MMLCITPGCACTAKTADQVDLCYSAADGRIAENVVSRRGNQPGQRALVRPDDRRPILRFCIRGGQPWKKKETEDRQTDRKREAKGGRERAMESEKDTTRMECDRAALLCCSVCPLFAAHRFFLLFCSLFFLPHLTFCRANGVRWRLAHISSEARTETAAEAGRCSLEISTLGRFWGSRC